MPTLSPALSYLSTASSRETILGIEEDKKPCICKSNKLDTRKNLLVVPLNCDDNLNLADEDVKKLNEKELEDLCVIRKQLMQIGNQQSSLLDLLQVLLHILCWCLFCFMQTCSIVMIIGNLLKQLNTNHSFMFSIVCS